jgi:uncharacterized caspase-like protein
MPLLIVWLIAWVAFLSNLPSAQAETRVALVVGNSAYRSTTPLTNPLNDARDMTAALKAAGFTVVEAIDAGKPQFDSALRTFADKLANADVALFFYAGHGLQVGAQNYLVPVDAKLERERDLEFEAVKLDFVLRQMEIDREGRTNIVILDACRDNPLSRNLARSMGTRSTAIGKGLAAASTGLGTFIVYSTQPGNVALDGDGRNSPFTTALVRHMGVKGRNLPAMMIEVRKDVVATTGGKQVPWDHSALTADFAFIPDTLTTRPGTAVSAPSGSSTDLAILQERLRKLEEEAKQRTAAVPPPRPPTTAAIPPVTPRSRPSQAPHTFSLDENVRIDGLKTNETREPSVAACQEACENEEFCIAFQHGRRGATMGQCQMFSRVEARSEDPAWRSGVRSDAPLPPEGGSALSSTEGRLPARFNVPISRKEGGFDIYHGLTIMGDQIKMSAADSPAGCQAICRNTSGCIAATYNDFFRGKNVACMVYGNVTNTTKSSTSTMMIRRE